VEVVAGLRENDRVVVEGTLKVREGAQVREASAAAPPGGEGGRPERAS
jgi:hypothetical protein